MEVEAVMRKLSLMAGVSALALTTTV